MREGVDGGSPGGDEYEHPRDFAYMRDAAERFAPFAPLTSPAQVSNSDSAARGQTRVADHA